MPETTADPRCRSATPAAIAVAAEILRDGGLVAFPTETVYGLGADATNDRAVARLFEAKGRPRFNPLIVHVASTEGAVAIARFTPIAKRLALRFWPGPLTLVLPRQRECAVSALASAGLDTVAIRVPNHPTALRLLETVERPIAAPSANRSGHLSPTTAAHVLRSLGDRVDLVLDAGRCRIGLESTVLDISGATPALLRPGAVARDEIEEETGPLAEPHGDHEALRSPGRLARHYAPDRPIRLNAHDVAADEALIAFGPTYPAGARLTLNLSPTGDLTEAAANLFSMLHQADASDVRGIAVTEIPDAGLGSAINDRLRRAEAAHT
jgi:L-threonylcarbamoyladenylate synthase